MSEAPLRDRPTVRVLLFDPQDRLLLMRGRLPGAPDGPSSWFTVGGGAEPGETVLEAAVREVREETGFTDVAFGPVIWRREGPLALAGGEVVMFREHYIVARCAGGEPSRDGWEALERQLIDDLRWWSLDELTACEDRIYPGGLLDRLPSVLAGVHPAEPVTIPWD
jgi:8-oxo-dGTP pyrophosphatase MutT (NUDIX family)